MDISETNLFNVPKRGQKESTELNAYFNTIILDKRTLRLTSRENGKVFIVDIENRYPMIKYININHFLKDIL